jgi:hypothetical protein
MDGEVGKIESARSHLKQEDAGRTVFIGKNRLEQEENYGI